MKLTKTLLGLTLLLCGSASASAEHYKIQVPLNEEPEDAIVYLMNFDTGDKIDSTTVKARTAVFEGEIDEPLLARIMTQNNRYGMFILEGGSISFTQDSGEAFGSMLNDRLRELQNGVMLLSQEFAAAPDDSTREEIYKRYNQLSEKVLKENSDNALGYFIFVQELPSMELAEMEKSIAEYPAFAGKDRVNKYLDNARKRAATQPGNKFVDFEVTYNGKTSRLSDYVGKGHYTLVDFWASWCGPCIRQTRVLKEIYNEYKDKGLEVLGVAVWDEPEATLEAIKQHDLPWECIINAQTVPTDLYGISGIPCIILFGPDGTILSRDKQDDALKADVRKYLDAAK